MLANNVLDLIGHTPIVRLSKIVNYHDAELYAKIEMFNPTFSIKDRIVYHIISEAERKGLIKPGKTTIVEATTGNTGAAVAMISKLKGYSCILATPTKTSAEKIAIMKFYGAEVKVCPTEAKKGEKEHYVSVAKQFLTELPDAFMIDQYNTPENARAHYLTTAKEILKQMPGNIDYFVACGSSGGTITGIGKLLKEHNPKTKIILADPVGSIYFDLIKKGKIIPKNIKPYRIEGVGKDALYDGVDLSIIDDVIRFTDEDAIRAAKMMISQEGLFVGGSSGAAIFAATELLKKLHNHEKVLTICPDAGIKYLSTIFADEILDVAS